MLRLALEVHAGAGEAALGLEIARTKQRAGQRRRIVAAVVLPGRVVGRVRVVGIHGEEPRRVGVTVAGDEVDGALGAPGRLVQLRRDVVMLRRGRHQPAVARRRVQQLRRIMAFLVQPAGVVVLGQRPVVARRVAVLEHAVAVVHARFLRRRRAGQVQLAHQPAVVAGVGQRAGDQSLGRLRRNHRVAIARIADPAGIHAGEEAGAAGRADGALAVGVRERHGLPHEAVEIRRANVRIPQRADGVEPLLVGAVPEDVGAVGGHGVIAAAGPAKLPRCAKSLTWKFACPHPCANTGKALLLTLSQCPGKDVLGLALCGTPFLVGRGRSCR